MTTETSNTQRRRQRGRNCSSPVPKRTTLDSSGIGLQLDKLEELLCSTIQPYCRENEGRHCRRQFGGISEQESLSRCDIQEIVSILREVLDAPSMPSSLVAKIHSTIGVLHLSEGETQLAIRSFTKALWIQTSLQSPVNRARNVGITLHRLAICRAQLGDADEAQSLLNKVLALYKASSKKKDLQMEHAQEELDRLQLEKSNKPERNLRRKSNEGMTVKLHANE